MRADIAHLATDEQIAIMEARIRKQYLYAQQEVEAKLQEYLAAKDLKEQKWKEWVATGKRTQAEYQEWLKGQIAIGKRWEEMRNTLAQDLLHAREMADSIIRDQLPDIYALNHNYATFEIEELSGVNTSYTLYSHETVARLFQYDDDLLPKGKRVEKEIAEGKLQRWEKSRLQSVMLQGILQGNSIPDIATRVSNAMCEDDRKAATRDARTMATCAQNRGRIDAYKRAAAMGIRTRRQWIATLDKRTRHEHRELDTQIVEIDKPFVIDDTEIMFPGDPEAPPHLVWNCRCTTVAVIGDGKGLTLEDRNTEKMTGEKDEPLAQRYAKWLKEKPVSQPILHQEKTQDARRAAYIRQYRENNSYVAPGRNYELTIPSDKADIGGRLEDELSVIDSFTREEDGLTIIDGEGETSIIDEEQASDVWGDEDGWQQTKDYLKGQKKKSGSTQPKAQKQAEKQEEPKAKKQEPKKEDGEWIITDAGSDKPVTEKAAKRAETPKTEGKKAAKKSEEPKEPKKAEPKKTEPKTEPKKAEPKKEEPKPAKKEGEKKTPEKTEEAKKAEEAKKQAEEKKKAEEAKWEAAKKKAEEEAKKRAAEKKKAEAARKQAEEKKKAEEAKKAAEKKKAEEPKQKQAPMTEEEKQKEERRKAREKKKAQAAKKEQEAIKRAEKAKKEEEERKAREKAKTEAQEGDTWLDKLKKSVLKIVDKLVNSLKDPGKNEDEVYHSIHDVTQTISASAKKKYGYNGPESNLFYDLEIYKKSGLIKTYGVNKKIPASMTEEQIINALGGGDATKGSCASVALAYTGMKYGRWDIRDFRGEHSRRFFSTWDTMDRVKKFEGVEQTTFPDEKGSGKYAGHVLNQCNSVCEEGREYLLAAGRHCAVIRKNGGKVEYLELQAEPGMEWNHDWFRFFTPTNGWHDLNKAVLLDRFGIYPNENYGTAIIDAETLGTSKHYKELLEYINTPVNEQMKGSGGAPK